MANRSIRLLALLLAALPAGPMVARAATVEDAPLSPEERVQFEETVARFRDRMKDFNVEAQLIADAWEAQERARLDASYSDQLSQLAQRKTQLRDESIKKFEAYLSKYPTSDHSPHVMFRLAELYYEVSEEEYALDSEEFNKATENLSLDAELPPEPQKDYRRSMALYQRIVDEHPDYQFTDGAYYMLGYCLGEVLSAQYDKASAKGMYTALVDKFPSSQFANQANMVLGEYAFDGNDLPQALVHYQRVVDSGPKAPLYDRGLYKLAWTYYRKASTRQEYLDALGLFTDLLDYSETRFQETGKASDTAPEGIEYMAIAFSEMASAEGGLPPLEEAKSWFDTNTGKPYEDKVFKRLADVLTQGARFEDAIATYEFIQQRWPDDPENATYQFTVARLYSNMPVADPEAVSRALMVLNERYSDGTPWAEANRANPDALDTARKYIEDSLASVATNFHISAQQTGNQEHYAKAAELYRQYLDKFPFANDYYEIESNLADVYFSTNQYEMAEKTYVQLLKAGQHDYRETAQWRVMQTRRQLLIDKYGKVEERPADAAEEKRVALTSGKERVIYKVGQQHADFIAICDELVDTRFEKDPELAKALDDNRAALAYLPAQILYYHGHFDEARKRFDEIIATWPEKDEAAYSATLVVDSYKDEENLMMVRQKSSEYAAKMLGSEAVGSDKAKVFKDLQEGATFKLAEELVARGDRAAAAEAYVAFMEEFPNSKYIKEAHYNAANNYEIIGRIDEANRLFEEYVNKHPTDERSQFLFFRIASNYSAVLELDKAIKYYETLVSNFPKYADAPTALYNAGFLRVGKGDFAGAARNYERYAKEYPAQSDAEQVMWFAADQWELVSPEAAQGFYGRYLRQYPEANPDHVMEAYYRIAKAAEKGGNARAIDTAWDNLGNAYRRMSGTGRIGPAGRHYAAFSEFRKLQRDLDAFKVYKYVKDDDKNAALMLKDGGKKDQVEDIVVRAVALIEQYKDFETSSAALYLAGDAYYTFADMLYNYPCPPNIAKLGEEACMLLTAEIDKIRIPVEDKGKNRLMAALDLAKEEKRWSEWQGKALELLNEKDPANFGTDKQELRGVGDSNLVPGSGPIPLRPPADEQKKENP